MGRDNRVRVPGEIAAELYQTYGVPPELFESLATDRGLAFDWDGYRRAMDEHGTASGKVQHVVMGGKGPIDSLKAALRQTDFLGYEQTETPATIKGIIVGDPPDDRLAEEIAATDHPVAARVVLSQTPFYGEAGGQVGDTGVIVGEREGEFQVTDTQREGGLVVHVGLLHTGSLREGMRVTARVDLARRDAIRRAHSATHILHHALQKNLGSHAQQQGSKVDDDWLRFDFTNLQPVAADELQAIEADVSGRVADRQPIRWQILPLADARQAGAMMLFGEKYPDPVRMVAMGNFSKELCGGTHLDNTGDVGAFEIVAEEGIAAGTRRIFALTGQRAREHSRQTQSALQQVAAALQVPASQVPAAVRQLAASVRELKKAVAGQGRPGPEDKKLPAVAEPLDYVQQRAFLREAARLLNVSPFDVVPRVEGLLSERESLQQQLQRRAQSGTLSAAELIDQAEDVAGTTVIVAELPATGANLMRQLIDQVRKTVDSSAVLLASREGDDKVTLVAGLSRRLVHQGLKAGDWVKHAARVVGGGGGGKPDMAQAGGKQPANTPAALAAAQQWIADRLR
jgi:alanyl-tRNA synthetase